jgi:EB1-like C-terminal motif
LIASDNLEFCQWLKAFHDQFGVSRTDYDAAGIRSKGKGTSVWCSGSSRGASRPVPARRPAPTTTARAPAAKAPSATSRPLRERPTAKQTQSNPSPSASKSTDPDAALVKKNTDLAAKVEELEQNLVDIEKERDFYFAKLRDVEIMLQVNQEKVPEERDYDALIEKVFKVLYATAEDNLVVTDDGEVRYRNYSFTEGLDDIFFLLRLMSFLFRFSQIVGGADDTLASGVVDDTLGMADELDDEDNLLENALQTEQYESF